MMDKINTAVREAIRIAETYVTDDVRRQEKLAKEIVAAISLCENELGDEIIRRMKSQTKG